MLDAEQLKNIAIELWKVNQHQVDLTLNELEKIKSDYEERDFFLGLGNFFSDINLLDMALDYFYQLTNLEPHNFAATFNIAHIRQRQGEFELAIDYYKQAIEIDPHFTAIYNNIANTYLAYGSTYKAERYLKIGLHNDPNDPILYSNLGGMYSNMGLYQEALDTFKIALEQNLNAAELWHNYLYSVCYVPNIKNDEVFDVHKKWNTDFLSKTEKFKTSYKTKNQTLRIGFLSGDFRNHAVAYFLLPLLEVLSLRKEEVICFANNDGKNDEKTQIFQSLADEYIDISQYNTEDAFNLITNKHLDVLIDLSGHTSGNRQDVLYHQPVKTQISWLGYPNSVGNPSIKWRIVDHVSDPNDESSKYLLEQPLRLNRSFLCYQGELSTVSSRITSDEVTFGCFNNLAKINEELIEAWSLCLKQVPNSRLIMKYKLLADTDVKARVLTLFAKHGVNEGKITLLSFDASHEDHMQRYSTVDIALDTFPYNGTTTTFEALSMNTPVITLCDNNHRSRVGKSILHHLGHKELVAYDYKEYIQKIVALAKDKKRLTQYHDNLRSTLLSSSLCDAQDFTNHFLEEIKHAITRDSEE